MLTAISGNYENGQVFFDEALPNDKKGRIVMMFLEDIVKKPIKKGVRLGGLEGKVSLPDDFNESLDDLKEYMY